MKRYLRIAMTALAMLLVMLFSAAITLRIALHGREVKVPELSGLTVQQASLAALKTGVGLYVENRFYSTTVPEGHIISQSPAPGQLVRHAWQVRVIESLGPQQVAIPNVIGQPVRAASIQIHRAQLDMGTLARIAAPGDPEVVLAQTPPPHAGLDQPRINLLLSAPAPDSATALVMPSLTGLTVVAASRLAESMGLHTNVGTGSNAASSTVAAVPFAVDAIVAAQSPLAGYRVQSGDTVRMTVAAAPAMPPGSTSAPVH